jgi:hypothetical protein
MQKRPNQNCPCDDPCFGKDPSAVARSWQGSGDYSGVDSYKNVVLKKGTVVYGGVPGQTAFYTNSATLLLAGGSASKVSELLQVKPHPIKGPRTEYAGYILKKDTCAASGKANANPQHGSGGGTQYFIPSYKTDLITSFPIKFK